jgi:hypothetical protein
VASGAAVVAVRGRPAGAGDHPLAARVAWLAPSAPALLFVAGVRVHAVALGEGAGVVESGALRTEPALNADVGAAVLAGELADIVARRGAWARVSFDDGRAGWIEAARVHPLDADAPLHGR